MVTIIILSVACFIAGLVFFFSATRKLGKAEGIIDSVALVMSRIKVENNQVGTNQSSLHEGDEKGISTKNSSEIQRQSVYELNLKSAQYSGVLHTFKREGKHRERPVMTYKWKNEDIYFEYSEDGSPIRLSGKNKKQILNVLEGGRCRNFKVYQLK